MALYELMGKGKARKVLSQVEYGEGIAIQWLDSGIYGEDLEDIQCHVRLLSAGWYGIVGETAICFMDNRLGLKDPRLFFGVWLGAITKITTLSRRKKGR